MKRTSHTVMDLLVLVGVLGLPLVAGALVAMMFLGVLLLDDATFSIWAIAAIAAFVLAIVLAHMHRRAL